MLSYDKKDKTSIKKAEISIAKNYLNEDEVKLLGLLVEQYLAFAETMAQQQTPMYMKDWADRLDSVLQLNGRKLLTHAGKILHKMAVLNSLLNTSLLKTPYSILLTQYSLLTSQISQSQEVTLHVKVILDRNRSSCFLPYLLEQFSVCDSYLQ